MLNRVLRHDIRNDVNLVEGYVDMADTDRLAEQDAHDMIREKTREIVDLSTRARKVEELLYDDATTQSVDLVAMVRTEMVHLRDGHPEDLIIDADLPDEAIVVGNDLLQSVVDNLLENAVEHTDASPIEIGISVRKVDQGYELAISDNGPGLPEHERRVITEGEETKLRHSSGMGLWLVNWIIPEFGGTITLGTGEKGGAEITIWLPQPGREAPAETDRSLETNQAGGHPMTQPTGTFVSEFVSFASFSDFLGFRRK